MARLALLVSAWVIAGTLATKVVLRIVAHDRLFVDLLLNTFTPYVYLPAYVVLALAIRLRQPALAGVAAFVILAHLVWTFGPYARAETRTGPATFRIVTTNVAYWNREPEWITAELLASSADVICVQELSSQWAESFASDAFARAYPHRIEAVRKQDGSAIYARAPLLEKDILETAIMPIARATVTIDGAPVRIYSVHPPAPSRPYLVEDWSRGLDVVLEAARKETLPVILAGDFNTTQHSAWYARLRDARFRASHDACGRPLATTWPNGSRNFPPIRLDHVFLPKELGCVNVTEGIGRASDHRPVIVDLRRGE